MDTGATRTLVSENLAHLCGTTGDTNTSPLMTGMVTFTAEFAGNSAVVTAWVSLSLQGMIIFGYQTLTDLGFIALELPLVSAWPRRTLIPAWRSKLRIWADFLESGQLKKSRLNCCHCLFTARNGTSSIHRLRIRALSTTSHRVEEGNDVPEWT